MFRETKKGISSEEADFILLLENTSEMLKRKGFIMEDVNEGILGNRYGGTFRILTDKGEDTGVAFNPQSFSKNDRWEIEGRRLDEFSNQWMGRGIEGFSTFEEALAEKKYYDEHGISLAESPDATEKRRKKYFNK